MSVNAAAYAHMSSIWVRTNYYLRGSNGEQLEVTRPEVI
jgi:hypothetical protein